MRSPICFPTYSDIHHANYSSGVTEADVYRVEEDITDFCLAKKATFCLFNGDRYLSHTPSDEIRVPAEKAQRRRNDEGIVTFSLLGNHDWKGKGTDSGHSNCLVQLVWPDLHPNLVIMDKPGSYRHAKVSGVVIHAIPAGFRFQWEHFDKPNPSDYNILVFHDLLEGAQIDVVTGYRAPKGVTLAELDHAEFDCVLGGDVHIPQTLPFTSTWGGYCGSPIQQSRRDRGGKSGFLFVTLNDKESEVEFINSNIPRFVDAEWDCTNGLPTVSEIEGLVQTKYNLSCEGNIVDLVFEGPRNILDEATSSWRESIRSLLKARRVNPPLKKVKVMKPLELLPSKVSGTPTEEFESFLKSGRAPLQGLDLGRLLSKATQVLTKLG
jgi:DNA repair exonuclease SbcCD nuclease subunit